MSSVSGFAVEVNTKGRKRLGKKSFIYKQERNAEIQIASNSEIRDLASKNTVKTPGSKSQIKLWHQWVDLTISSIRYDLSCNLNVPADTARFENLFYNLGVAADNGQMPSFEDPGARSGYALEFFCRARQLADLFLDSLIPDYTFPDFWVDEMMKTPMLGGGRDASARPYRIVSLGGGPAFDFVGVALAAMFSASGEECAPMHATIYDYEEGWGDLVESMDVATRNILQQSQLSCQWGGKCDITKPISHENNSAFAPELGVNDMFVCQFCIAENANLLRESNFVFFKELFEKSAEGSIFIFTETTPRIWPELYDVVEEHCRYMEVGFNQKGRQMLLKKGKVNMNAVALNSCDTDLLMDFREIATRHQRKLDSGYTRQVRKIRGRKKAPA